MSTLSNVSSTTEGRSISRRDLLLCLSGTAAISAGVGVEAMLMGRQYDPVALAAASRLLQLVPKTIGPWTSVERSIDERELKIAEIHGWIRREYHNQQTGYSVTLTLLSGAAGPMCVHPPTACFEGIGYTLNAGPSVVAVSGNDGNEITLNRASFHQQDDRASEVIRVFWGWSTAGRWESPANPRMAFRGEPVLYKIYVVDRAIDRTVDRGDDIQQAEAFLMDALPVIRDALTPTATT